MSFHNKPDYHIPELIEALKAHRLPHDTTPASGAADLPEALRLAAAISNLLCSNEAAARTLAAAADELVRLHTESEMRRTALLIIARRVEKDQAASVQGDAGACFASEGGQQCRVEPEPAGTNAPRSPILTTTQPPTGGGFLLGAKNE